MLAMSYCIGGCILLHWWPPLTTWWQLLQLCLLHATAMLIDPTIKVAAPYYNSGRILLQWWPHPSTLVATSNCNSGRIVLLWWLHTTMTAASCYHDGLILYYNDGRILLHYWTHFTTMVAASPYKGGCILLLMHVAVWIPIYNSLHQNSYRVSI